MSVGIIWSDLSHIIRTDQQGSIRLAVNIDAVKTSIDNILRTNLGERVMLPQFGSNLGGMLFEPTSREMFDQAADELKDVITAWDDRVVIDSIEGVILPNESQITLKIRFTIVGYDQIFEHNTNLTGDQQMEVKDNRIIW